MAERKAGRAKPAPDRSGVAGLTGGGPSIVGVSGAMRARDISRPRPEHYAAAEETVVLKRRQWEPPPEASAKQRPPVPAPPARATE